MNPLVSVITATWQRHDLLLNRCIPSIAAQDYPGIIEHIVVSDGPDPQLAARLPSIIELPAHTPSRFGHHARVKGIGVASGEFLAYLDDDDSWRPAHIRLLMEALQADPQAGFAYSRTIVHTARGPVRIGDGPLAHGRITPGSGMLHRRDILATATWQDESGAPDWDLVRRWAQAGIPYISVDAETVDYYPNQEDFSNAVPVSFRPLS